MVDASGRGSRTPAWLEALGYTPPEVELVEVKMGYATRFYHRQPDHLDGDLMVNIAPTPQNERACGMLAQEGDRWIVTLAGYFGDYPPMNRVFWNLPKVYLLPMLSLRALTRVILVSSRLVRPAKRKAAITPL